MFELAKRGSIIVRRFCFLSLAVFPACGSATPPAEHAETETQDTNEHDSSLDQIGMSAEIGAMPMAETEYAFKQAFKGIQRCFTDHVNQLEFIGGEIAIKVLVNSDGQVKDIFAERSSIGHDATEQCMFDALRKQDWPKPVGGLTGIAENAFAFEMTGDVRPPVQWSEADIGPALDEIQGELSACKADARGVVATLYVDTEGHAMGVGVSGQDEKVERARACLVELLSSATYPSPGSWPAKVSIRL